jgi:hypothetical protein
VGDDGNERLPVFDREDARLAGWEMGVAGDGDFVIQARCRCGCEVFHALKFAPGAFIAYDRPGGITAKDIEFHGPMEPPAFTET